MIDWAAIDAYLAADEAEPWPELTSEQAHLLVASATRQVA